MKKKAYVYISIISVCCILFQLAFYFGYKNYEQKKMEQLQSEQEARKETVSVGTNQAIVLNHSAEFTCKYYNKKKKKKWEETGKVASAFVGWNREELQKYLQDYLAEPPSEEQEKGLAGYDLLSFSSDYIQIEKVYAPKQKYKYLLVVENNEVVIYDEKWEKRYEQTGIFIEDLGEEEKNKLMEGIYVKDEAELYSILEDYSS